MSGGSEKATQIVNFGEVAYFRVPSNWMIGREEDGGMVIFEDREGSGTLRLWTEEYAFDTAATRDLAAVGAVHNGFPTEAINERINLSYTVFDGEEAGEALRFHQWILTIRTGENRMRLVTFIHTVESVKEGSEDTAWELWVINQAVRNAYYPDAFLDDDVED